MKIPIINNRIVKARVTPCVTHMLVCGWLDVLTVTGAAEVFAKRVPGAYVTAGVAGRHRKRIRRRQGGTFNYLYIIYVFIYIYIYINLSLYIYIYIYIYILFMCVYIYIYIYIYLCMYTCI